MPLAPDNGTVSYIAKQDLFSKRPENVEDNKPYLVNLWISKNHSLLGKNRKIFLHPSAINIQVNFNQRKYQQGHL